MKKQERGFDRGFFRTIPGCRIGSITNVTVFDGQALMFLLLSFICSLASG